ncbi:hypothetical protein DVH05_012342 [Phytophthora capsici]|nr:hypothetical protein DVH05_012342 [Phytophthora capsici]
MKATDVSEANGSNTTSESKAQRTTTHDSRVSLCLEYAKGSKRKAGCFDRKLEFEKSKWRAEQEEKARQAEYEHRKQLPDNEDRVASGHHDIIMALVGD